MTEPDPTLVARFWKKVDKRGPNDCWPWTGSRGDSGKGYGQTGAGGKYGKRLSANRLSWEIHFGPIPPGVQILHRCDNRACVSPAHLFLGSQADNVRDMIEKRRWPIVRLRPQDVAEIRRMREAGVSSAEIAAIFSISPAHARKVGGGKAWRHVS